MDFTGNHENQSEQLRSIPGGPYAPPPIPNRYEASNAAEEQNPMTWSGVTMGPRAHTSLSSSPSAVAMAHSMNLNATNPMNPMQGMSQNVMALNSIPMNRMVMGPMAMNQMNGVAINEMNQMASVNHLDNYYPPGGPFGFPTLYKAPNSEKKQNPDLSVIPMCSPANVSPTYLTKAHRMGSLLIVPSPVDPPMYGYGGYGYGGQHQATVEAFHWKPAAISEPKMLQPYIQNDLPMRTLLRGNQSFILFNKIDKQYRTQAQNQHIRDYIHNHRTRLERTVDVFPMVVAHGRWWEFENHVILRNAMNMYQERMIGMESVEYHKM